MLTDPPQGSNRKHILAEKNILLKAFQYVYAVTANVPWDHLTMPEDNTSVNPKIKIYRLH